MEGNNSKGEQIVDVRKVVEAITTSADDDNDIDVPLYQIESLCMRCGQNVIFLAFSLLLHVCVCMYVCICLFC